MSKSKPKIKTIQDKSARGSQDGEETAMRKPARLKRLVIGFVLMVGAWLACMLTLDSWIHKALTSRNLTSAVAWARPASWLKPWDTELPLLRAKTARLAGDMESWSAQMQPFATKANSPAITEELLFGKVTLGDFPDTFHALMGKMLDTAPSGEVAEAFVLGLLANHDRENARAILDAWKRDEPQSAQVEFVEAVFEEVVGNRREAMARLASFSQEHPMHQPVRARLANLYLSDRHFEPAMKELKALVAQGDDSASTTIKLARCQRFMGDVDEAKSQLTRLLSGNVIPSSQNDLTQREQAQRELAQCQLELGEYADAAKTLRAAGVNHLEPEEQTDLALADYLSGNTETADTVYSAIAKSRQFQSRRSDLEVYMVLNPQDEKARREMSRLSGGMK
jgi:tetratricopeptide (TPR) repeat protein